MKERIIGAAVLVLIVVLVVPVFLDGPPDSAEMVSERVLLPGQEGQTTQTIVLDRDRSEPVPVASSQALKAPPAEVKPAAESKQDPPAPEPDTAPLETAIQNVSKETKPVQVAPSVSSTGMWAVQLGSFSNKDNAERLAAELRKQGYAAFLSQLASDGGQLHRVRIGPQKDREGAEAMAARLLKAGHKGQVVPHP